MPDGQYNDLGGSAIVSKSLSTSGYIMYMSGLILQWGNKTFNGSTRSITYNVTFPAKCCSLTLTGKWGLMSYHSDSSITTGATFDFFSTYGGLSTTPSANQITFNWIAIGN